MGAIGPIRLAPSDAAMIDARGIAAELDTVKLDSTGNAALQLDSHRRAAAIN